MWPIMVDKVDDKSFDMRAVLILKNVILVCGKEIFV
jgi:hypothetical protein